MNKIKQNLAGFAAVVIAGTALTAIAPANAAGTSVTTSQVGYTSVQRSNSTINGNSITVSATVGADESLSNTWANLKFADSTHLFTAQVGDAIKLTATYVNVTDGSTANSISASCSDWNAHLSVSPYTYTNGNECNYVNGSNNVVTKTTTLTNLAAGTYDNLSFNQNVNVTDSSVSAGDQLTLTFAAFLVRGGVDTALNLATSGVTNEVMMNFSKVGTVNHTAAATDTYINFNSTFCVFRGENGVTNNTQIDVTVTNAGSGNTMSAVSGNASIYGAGAVTGTSSGNTRSYVMPASGWDVVNISAYASVLSNNVTVGQTFTPVITAVISGTSTNVLDLCSRNVPGFAAPTATPSNSTGVSLSWTAPTLPVAGSWDTIRVYACPTTLNTCGNYQPMGYYFMPGARPQFATNRSTGMIAANATTYTATTSSMQTYMTGPGQVASAWTASASLQYFVVYEDMQSPFYAVSALSSATSAGGQVQQQVQQNNVAPTVPTNIPVVAPIKVPVMGINPGASLVLAGENMKSLTSVKIGANTATTKTTVAGLEIVVPADLKPGAHDLLIATSTGSTLFVGAIKVADPVVVAAKAAVAKAAASIAFRAPVDLTVSKSVTGSQAAQVKAIAAQYKTAKTAICEAIPASKATVASARAAAVKVCATIKAAIPGIKTLIVVSAPSGEKANRVSSEIQG